MDSLAVAAVFLVDGPADSRILFLIPVCNLCGVVLYGTVVHNQDFYLISSGKKGVDAVFHIRRRIIAWDCN